MCCFLIIAHLFWSLKCEQSYFSVCPVRQTNTWRHTSTKATGVGVFTHDLQQFEIVSSLKSHPRTADYLRSTGFSECPCFYLHLFTFTCLVCRKKSDEMHAVTQPQLLPLSLSVSRSNILISMTGHM